jgi:Protein of unknown function (DUF3102)
MSKSNITRSLADLAACIRSEHEAVCQSARQTLQHAIKAGELLLEAKRLVGHGPWSQWLDEHCDVSQRSAQAYMRLAKNRTVLAKAQSSADLTIDQALQVLAKPKPAVDEVAAAMVIVEDYLPEKGQARIGLLFLPDMKISEIFMIIESRMCPGYYDLDHIENFSDEYSGGTHSCMKKPVRADGIKFCLAALTRHPQLLHQIQWHNSVDWPFPPWPEGRGDWWERRWK